MPEVKKPQYSRILDLPTRILVTGDTHIGRIPRDLPASLIRATDDVDLIVHVGDFCSLAAHQRFESLGELVAVRGNNDDMDLALKLPDQRLLGAGSLEILVVHGHRERGSSARAVMAAYSGTFAIVIYGHSHVPHWEEDNGTYFLNPGSPLQKRRQKQFSYAFLAIDQNERIDAELVLFDPPV